MHNRRCLPDISWERPQIVRDGKLCAMNQMRTDEVDNGVVIKISVKAGKEDVFIFKLVQEVLERDTDFRR